jgi:aspartyl-tRNA(Asn)/glutamyl-tRNA(Gln) amidotransferase subunit C
MSVDKDTVVKIAALARIEVPEADLERLAAELSNILDWVAQLDEVDTDAVEPMAAVMPMALRLREDVVDDGGYATRVLNNAPEVIDGCFVVPRVVE